MDAAVKKLATYDGPDRVVSSVVYSQMLKDRPVVPRHDTGIASLDTALEGFEPGELIVVSGPTAMGKTTLCQTIIRNLNRAGKRSLFFSYEVTPAKMIQMHLDPENCVYLPLEHKAMDLSWLRERTMEAIEKYAISAVFIDHLHYVIDMRSQYQMSLEIGATMRYLKRDIALSLNMPVFIVCHAAKVPLDREPSIHDLRDSSFVGQEADTVLIVFRRLDKDLFGKPQKTMLQGLATVKVDKARRSGVMGVKIKVKKENHELIESKYEPEE
jgi:replicative DNA helicase